MLVLSTLCFLFIDPRQLRENNHPLSFEPKELSPIVPGEAGQFLQSSPWANWSRVLTLWEHALGPFLEGFKCGIEHLILQEIRNLFGHDNLWDDLNCVGDMGASISQIFKEP